MYSTYDRTGLTERQLRRIEEETFPTPQKCEACNEEVSYLIEIHNKEAYPIYRCPECARLELHDNR